MSWRATLRSPKGQLRLLVGTLLAAAVFAAGLGTRGTFFEGYVREKYGEPLASEAQAAASLVAGEGAAAPERLELAYRHWMRGEGGAPLARALGRRAEGWTVARVERTLVAGTVEQRRRSVALLVEGEVAAGREPVARILERTRRMGPSEVVADLERALAALPGG
jgi:hypothetical protein